MMGIALSASLGKLLRSLKTSSYDNMNRMARDWSPGDLPMPEAREQVKDPCLLSFSSRSRKRLNWIRQACGQGH